MLLIDILEKNNFSLKDLKDTLKNGVDVNYINSDEDTPLSIALDLSDKNAKLRHKKNQTIKALLKFGANVRQKLDNYRENALVYSFEDPGYSKNTDIIKLITSYAEPLSKEERLISQICMAKTWEDIEPYIWSNKCYKQRFFHKKTLLMYALEWGKDISIIKNLIDKGSDLKAKNDIGWTVLHFESSDYDKIKLLLENGANVNAVDNDGDANLLDFLYMNKDCIRILSLILSYHPTLKTLKHIWKESCSCVKKFPKKEYYKLLLDSGINPNFKLNNGSKEDFSTALIEFTKYSNRKDLIQLLFDYGANPNLKDGMGTTALEWGFIECASNSIIKILLKNGANPNLKDNFGRTVFDYAHGRPLP